MKKAIPGFLLMLLALHAPAQNTYTKVLWDSAEAGVWAHAMAQASDGGFFLAGEFTNSLAGLLVKLDSGGMPAWNRKFASAGADKFYSVVSTQDSGFAVAGTLDNGAFCARVDGMGDTVWTSLFDVAGSFSSVFYSITGTFDNGFALSGVANYSVSPYTRTIVARLDSAGNLAWSLVLQAANWQNISKCIRQAPDSGFALSGLIEDNAGGFTIDGFMLSLSPSGTVEWSSRYGFSSGAYCRGEEFTISVTGGFAGLFPSSGLLCIVYLDSAGNILSNNNYTAGATILLDGSPYRIRPDGVGGHVIMVTSDQAGSFSANFMRVDSGGNADWIREMFFGAADVTVLNDGFLCLGIGPLFGVSPSQSIPFSPQIGLIRTDSIGSSPTCNNSTVIATQADSLVASPLVFNIIGTLVPVPAAFSVSDVPLILDSGCVNFIGGLEEANGYTVNLYPNPVSGRVNVESDSPIIQLAIRDFSGKLLMGRDYGDIKPLTVRLDISSLAPGLYMVHVWSRRGHAVKKLLKF